jgi:glucose/arabinose dehydrogenase
MFHRHAITSLLTAATLGGCASPDYGIAEPTVLATGFDIPDRIVVLGEDEFLVNDRKGALYRVVDGTPTEVSGIPTVAGYEAGGLWFGGLLDVSLHPDFSTNQQVYIAYDDPQGLNVARFTLDGTEARDLEVVLDMLEGSIGSRIAWQDADHFFLSIGIGGNPTPDPGPQNLLSAVGKIFRLHADGSIPEDNPIYGEGFPPSAIWSFGHRNPQGFFYDEAEETLYASEHGPQGGDEINVIDKGANYGWPLFSAGLNYDDTPVSEITEAEAGTFSVLPLKTWGPEFRMAPSGLLRPEGSTFTGWNGSFLLGALYPQSLVRWDPQTDETELVASDIGRVRDVAQLPSGDLVITMDAGSPRGGDSGRLVRLSPAAP